MTELTFFAKLFIAFIIGAIIGLEREFSLKERVPIGLRDFALTAVLGLLISEFTLKTNPIFVVIGFAGIVLVAILFYISRSKVMKVPGITTILMLPLTYIMGTLVSMGLFIEAATIVTLTTLLLIQKQQVHAFAASVVKNEILDLLVFILIAFVIFPLIPTQPLVFLEVAFDAYSFWLVIVFMTTISFAAHFLIKYLSGRRAVLLASFLGGLISSIAAIALLAKKTLHNHIEKVLRVGVTSASAAALLRDFILTALIALPLATHIVPIMSLAFISLIALTIYYYKTTNFGNAFISERPISLIFVIEFAAIFFATKIILTWVTTNYAGFGLIAAFLTGIVSSASSIAAIALLLTEGKLAIIDAQTLWISAFFGSLLGKVLIVSLRTKSANLVKVSIPLIITAILTIIGTLAVTYLKF